VEGESGDWLLENERLSVVISHAPRPGSFAMSGGAILDAAPRGGRDVLREVFGLLDDDFPRQPVYLTVDQEPVPDPKERAVVARGFDSGDSAISVETRYLLRAGSDSLRLVTTLVNTGAHTWSDYELGDAITWGRARQFAPGPGFALPGTRPTVEWVGAQGEGTAYVWRGQADTLGGPHGGVWSNPVTRTVTLAPGDTVIYRRALHIHRGSIAEVPVLLGDSGGNVRFMVEGDGGVPVADTRVTVHDHADRPVMTGVTRADGSLRASLPPGDYRVKFLHAARGTRWVSARVGEKNVTVRAKLHDPGHVLFSVRGSGGDLLSAKWIFEGVSGTEHPDFGPDYSLPGALNVVFTPTGEGSAQVPPGRYRVTCSRGTAYEIWQRDVDVRPGRRIDLQAELFRIPIPHDWVPVDLHVHSLSSPDCNVSPADRLGAMACEGIRWFAVTDHGHRSDFAGARLASQSASPVDVILGEEVTSTRFGHVGAFPVSPRPDGPGHGAFAPGKASAKALLEELRSDPRTLVQVNHPRSGRDGFLDAVGFDPAGGRAAVDSLPVFDLLEVINGKRGADETPAWDDWMALLAAGRRVVGVGNSDTHRLVGQEGGYPRNWVLTEPSSSPSADPVLDGLRRGRVVVSNGPFVEFEFEGGSPGDTVHASAGTLRGRIRVTAPAWVDVHRVSIVVGGKVEAEFRVKGRGRSVRFDEEIEVSISHSTFVLILVEGEAGLSPVVSPRAGGDRVIRPIAFSNPVWVTIRRGSG